MVPLTTKKAQSSGVVNSSYEKVILLRIQEFKNAFLEWVILDDISHRKACSKRLLRVFKIANLKASRALPSSPSLIVTWVHDLHRYFEPDIVKEIRTTKSRISISFNR